MYLCYTYSTYTYVMLKQHIQYITLVNCLVICVAGDGSAFTGGYTAGGTEETASDRYCTDTQDTQVISPLT
jgi:hypothetical protein